MTRHARLSPVAKIIASAITFCFAFSSYAEAPFAFASTPGKLPKDVVPLEYQARFEPDLANNSLKGEETIEIEVLQATQTIMLNAKEMAITSASLRGKDLPEIALTPVLNDAQQTLSFALTKPLAPGKYFLKIAFQAQIHRQAYGMFGMDYQVNGVAKKMIATTLEPSDARALLPSWDEPAFRAKFTVSVDLPANLQAVSNTPISKQQKLENGKLRTSFATTPKMSSYLLVLVAGEMERISATQDGVELGVITTAGKVEQGRFALNSSKDMLRYFNNYFGVAYPLAKLDHIAIPGGFNGAMENWGGIVYNDAAILYDPQRSPATRMQTSFSIVAHETAHQWFGDLVTMAWWDNLWLNEGFASWMGEKATDHFHPEWQVRLGNLASRERVLSLDSRLTTHPIQTPIENEEQAAGAFDSITYGKGQAFLEMLENYLGEEVFREGIRLYMQRHQYGNTTTADLWAALAKASGKPIAKLAADWTTQAGFPLLQVTQSCEKDVRTISFSQQRFLSDGNSVPETLWQVPIQYQLGAAKPQYFLLDRAKASVQVAGCSAALVVDPNSVGFFRLQYDQASLQALARQMPTLSDATRLKLVGDMAALVNAGRMPLVDYFALLENMRNEPRRAVWESMLSPLETLLEVMQDSPEEAQIKRFVIYLAQERFKQLGWHEKSTDSVEERQLRSELASALAQAGAPEVIHYAQQSFQTYLREPKKVPLSLLDFVIRTAGRYADSATYDNLYKLAHSTQATEERNRYLSAMSYARDAALAKRTLQLTLSPNLPLQSINHLLAEVAQSRHYQLAWEFADQHRDALLKLQEPLERNHYFSAIVASSNRPEDADMLEAYVKKHLGAEAQVDASRTAALIRDRAARKKLLQPQLQVALQRIKN